MLCASGKSLNVGLVCYNARGKGLNILTGLGAGLETESLDILSSDSGGGGHVTISVSCEFVKTKSNCSRSLFVGKVIRV